MRRGLDSVYTSSAALPASRSMIDRRVTQQIWSQPSGTSQGGQVATRSSRPRPNDDAAARAANGGAGEALYNAGVRTRRGIQASALAAERRARRQSENHRLTGRRSSSKCVVASTIAFARVSGSPDLKIPEPTKTPSAPSCMQSAASAGVAMPPAVNVTTGSRPFSATQRTSSYGARCSFAAAKELVLTHRLQRADRRRTRRACASRH